MVLFAVLSIICVRERGERIPTGKCGGHPLKLILFIACHWRATNPTSYSVARNGWNLWAYVYSAMIGGVGTLRGALIFFFLSSSDMDVGLQLQKVFMLNHQLLIRMNC